MAATNPNTLMQAARCDPCIPEGMRLAVLINLFAQIAGVSTNPNTLMQAARCMACIPTGDRLPVLIYLADQIVQGGGAGGGGVYAYSGNGSPNGVVFPLVDTATYFQKDSTPAGIVWEWYDAAWH